MMTAIAPSWTVIAPNRLIRTPELMTRPAPVITVLDNMIRYGDWLIIGLPGDDPGQFERLADNVRIAL